jgi:hypothetical protein
VKFSHEKKNRQKWTFFTTFFVKTVYLRPITVIFSLKAFTRRVEQAIVYPIWPKLLKKKTKKKCKFLNFLAILPRLGVLKILKSRRTKVVSNKHLLRL